MSATTVSTHQWLTSHGFKCVALHPKSKAAVSRAYVEANYSPPPITDFMNSAKNIGMVLGFRAGGGACDIDLDCPEAMKMAKDFLPATRAVFGRKSKPSSHFVYKITESCDTLQIADKSSVPIDGSKMMLELRADSKSAVQTVAPGSVHESGELVDWADESDHEPSTVAVADLVTSVKRLASAVMVVRHFWAKGLRYNNTLHIAGMMYKSGWSVDDAVHFFTTVIEHYSDRPHPHNIEAVRAAFQKGESGKPVAGFTALKSETGDDIGVLHLASLLRIKEDPVADALQSFGERWAVVHYAGKTRIASLTTQPGHKRKFFDVDDFHQWTANERVDVEVDGKTKVVPISKLWFPNARRYLTTFKPGVEDCDDINVWTGWATSPSKGDFSAFTELLTGLCGDQRLFDAVMQFLANIVREPMVKPKTILSFIGGQNAGKTLWGSYLKFLFGDFMDVFSTPDHITGRFNEHLTYLVLAISEEAVFAKNHQHQNQLKALSGDHTMTSEVKGGSVSRVPNYVRVVMFSNSPDAAPVEAGDSRYIIIDTRDFKCPTELAERVRREMNGDGPAALMHHLKTMDYDLNALYDAKEVMKSSASAINMKMSTEGPIAQWWRNVLHSGQMLPTSVCSLQKPYDADWPQVVARPALYNDFLEHCRTNNVRHVPHQVAFWLSMSKMTNNKLTNKTTEFSVITTGQEDPKWVLDLHKRRGKRVAPAVHNFPSLHDCRDAFCSYMGINVEWPEMDGATLEPTESLEY